MTDKCVGDVGERDAACPDLGHGPGVCKDRICAGKTPALWQRKLTIAEAAQHMGIGVTSLRRLTASGAISVMRVTKTKVLLLEEDIERYLQDRRGRVVQQAARPSRRRGSVEAPGRIKHFDLT